MTKRINGGTIGLEDRKKHYARTPEVLGGTWESSKVVHSTVRKGSKGETVKAVPKVLGHNQQTVTLVPGTEDSSYAMAKEQRTST